MGLRIFDMNPAMASYLLPDTCVRLPLLYSTHKLIVFEDNQLGSSNDMMVVRLVRFKTGK